MNIFDVIKIENSTMKIDRFCIICILDIPLELRREALRCAILLMPDENREVLYALLSFLLEVSAYSSTNQMSASNLAVCLAPSLFHMQTSKPPTASPRRRKAVGVPDQRELNENKAAHECLTTLITDCYSLNNVSSTKKKKNYPCYQKSYICFTHG